MKVLRTHHRYLLENFEDKTKEGQTIQFIEKEAVASNGTDVAFHTVNDGTTNEEVLAMLIDRMQGLNAKLPSRETALAITKLEEALMWCERRTALRKARGVEGTPKA